MLPEGLPASTICFSTAGSKTDININTLLFIITKLNPFYVCFPIELIQYFTRFTGINTSFNDKKQFYS
jgi:hypothetical protein